MATGALCRQPSEEGRKARVLSCSPSQLRLYMYVLGRVKIVLHSGSFTSICVPRHYQLQYCILKLR